MSLQRARGAFLKIAARFMGCTRSTFRIRLLSDIKVYVHYQILRFMFAITNKQTAYFLQITEVRSPIELK